MTTDYAHLLLNQPLDIFDQLYESIVITTAQLDGNHPKIIYVNDAFSQMTGYTKDEIIGLTPRILQGSRTDKKAIARLR